MSTSRSRLKGCDCHFTAGVDIILPFGIADDYAFTKLSAAVENDTGAASARSPVVTLIALKVVVITIRMMPTRRTDLRLSKATMWQWYERRRYVILFYTLLMMLIAAPVVTALGLPQVIVQILVAACLLGAVMPQATKRTRWAFFSAVMLLIMLRFLAEPDEIPINFGPVLVLFAMTGLFATLATLHFVVRSPRIDSETIYAALGTYLLAGLFFGVLYTAIEFMQPGSFIGPDSFTQANAIYYSFVTLATLGYGDFLPKSELARGVATFEVIGGQLYLAAMVARLIGAFGTTRE